MAGQEITVKAALTFRLIEGQPQDADSVLDCLAAELGRQNASRNPLRLTIGLEDEASVYECELVDEA